MENIPQKVMTASRFLFGVFGLVFTGVGLTVLAFLWFGNDGFDSPPLFFKIFGSFIAIAFVAFGGTMAFSAIMAGGILARGSERFTHLQARAQENTPDTRLPSPGSYLCPNCGATLGNAEVSPLGDVKCTFCGSWFNIHGRK